MHKGKADCHLKSYAVTLFINNVKVNIDNRAINAHFLIYLKVTS